MPKRLMHKSPENWDSFPGRAEAIQQDSVTLCPLPFISHPSPSSMVFMQKRVNIAGLNSCPWKVVIGWHLGTQIFGGLQPVTGKIGSLCLNYASNVVDAEHLLSFWESGILLHARQRLPT